MLLKKIIKSTIKANEKSKQKPRRAPKITTENVSIQRLIPKSKEWGIDTVMIHTRKTCPYCNIYDRKVFSLYGWDKKYPRVPDLVLRHTCPQCGVIFGASGFFPGISTEPK